MEEVERLSVELASHFNDQPYEQRTILSIDPYIALVEPLPEIRFIEINC